MFWKSAGRRIVSGRCASGILDASADPAIRNKAGHTIAPYFAIAPKEEMMSREAKAARQAVRDWLTEHGYGELLQ